MQENREIENKIETFYDAASWLTQSISTGSLKENDLEPINDRLQLLFPAAIDYNKLLETSKFNFPVPEEAQRLESAASALWNAIAIAIKIEKNEAVGQMLCYSRLFVCILLTIHETMIPSINRKLRVTHCYISTLKVVIDHEWVELQQLNTIYLEENLSSLKKAANSFNEKERVQLERLELEFHVLKIQEALKHGNIDLARKYENQANIVGNVTILDSTLLLDLCRIIYNATLLLTKETPGDIDSVNYFLERAYEYLELEIPSLKTHVDYSILRYSILLLLTDSQINHQVESCDKSKCMSLLEVLQNEYPKKLESYSLEINFCKKVGGSSVPREIKNIIMKMITSVDLLLNFDAIIGIINEFANLDTRLSLECLDYIFLNKCDPERDHKWLEKLLVFRFFLTTQSKHLNNVEIIRSLEEYCSKVERIIMNVLSKEVMSSVITLLWNSGKKAEKAARYSESIGFYKIALKNFISQGYTDRGKIQRALMFAHIQMAEFNQCEELYQKMTISDKYSPLTQVIILQIFIKQSDEKSCLQCLQRIKESDYDNAMDALILAVSECRTSKKLAIKAISILFEAIESHQAPEQKLIQWSVPTLCLLRYTSQLILKFVEDEQPQVFTQYLPTMQDLLQKALGYLNRTKTMEHFHDNIDSTPQYQEGTSVDVIEWFASTSYNLALKCVTENMDDTNSLDFAQLSGKFIKLIPLEEFTFPKMFHYTYWYFRSHLLCLSIIQTLKCRGNPNALPQIQRESLALINDISKKRSNQDFKDGCGSHENEKMHECLSDALLLAFEASLQMQDQIKISEIITTTANWQDPRIENLLADTAISMYELPRGLFLETIEPLIMRNVDNQLIDHLKICQWLRNFLDCALTLEKTLQPVLTGHVLQRIKEPLSNNDVSNTAQLKQEIEMIATLSWNQGVNSIIKGEKMLGMEWCQVSVQFASLYSEQLEKQLKDLWSSLASSVELS